MKIRILGSAAGGGVPQWNCRCGNCEAARGALSAEPEALARDTLSLASASGSFFVRPRTQSSVAVSADERTWFVLNISPDIRQQILAFPALGPPPSNERGKSIAGCILTDAELDHTAGLLSLREGGSFAILSTRLVRRWLNRYLPVEPLLASFAKPAWVDLPLETPMLLTGSGAGRPPIMEKQADWKPAPQQEGLLLRAFEVEPHIPRFVTENEEQPAGSVIGLVLQDLKTKGTLVYAPCIGSLKAPLLSVAHDADVLLIDGTFWSDDEPLRFGIGRRTAVQMGHLPVSGPQGSLAWLADLPVRHRVYIHINNTNPMLNERGPEYRLVNSSGVRVGADGDTFEI